MDLGLELMSVLAGSLVLLRAESDVNVKLNVESEEFGEVGIDFVLDALRNGVLSKEVIELLEVYGQYYKGTDDTKSSQFIELAARARVLFEENGLEC